MTAGTLPEGFADLETWCEWSLGTMAERSAKRTATSMAEIGAFYEAMLPRMEAVLSFLQQFTPEDPPGEVETLLNLAHSFAEVAPAVECFGQQTVPYGFDVARFIPGPAGV